MIVPPAPPVRAGSVVLLVGVGSLVCWRLWAHWRYGVDEGEDEGEPKESPTTSPTKAASRAPRRTGLLASLLEEELFQESEDMDEDDPALIQGRYFGPDSPGIQASRRRLRDGRHSQPGTLLTKPCPQHGSKCDVSCCNHQRAPGQHRAQRTQLLGTPPSGSEGGTTPSASNTSTPSDHRYLADHSASASSRDRDPSSSSGGEEGMAEERTAARCRRRKKRQQRASLRLSGSSGGGTEDRIVGDHRVGAHRDARLSSSREREPRSIRFYANAGTDEEYSSDANRDESEGVLAGASYSDLMERMRVRQVRRSLSREPSICSNLSDVLMSPGSQRRFPFRRDDSVCSNLSDFTVSECSELSMDVSVKEEVNNTFRCLEEIEQDLDEMKSSLLQMDEEVAMFVTKPDPYSLKMTFSDYSLSSKEENDSLPYLHDEPHLSTVDEAIAGGAGVPTGVQTIARGRLGGALAAGPITVSDEFPAVPERREIGTRASDTDAEGSLEWDSPQHGWSSVLPFGAGTSTDQKEEGLVSLEWDDGAVKQHPEPRPLRREDSTHTFHDNTAVSLRTMDGYDAYKKSCRRSQLLPDHSSMELDLEEELAGPSSLSLNSSSEQSSSLPHPGITSEDTDKHTARAATFAKHTYNKFNPVMTASTDSAIVTSMTTSGMTTSSISTNDLTGSFTIAANMTGSTDSAIYSAPGSRSATASPLPALFSQSTLRYAGARQRKQPLPSSLVAAFLPTHHPSVCHVAPRPVSLQVPMHEQPPSQLQRLNSDLTALPTGCHTTEAAQHRHSYHHDLSLYPPVHNISQLTPLSFINKDLSEFNARDQSILDRWLAEYPAYSSGSTLSCDSGVSSHRFSGSYLCSHCRRSTAESDYAPLHHQPDDGGTASSDRRCNPCTQCVAVLNTVSAVHDMCSVLSIQPCQNYEAPTRLGHDSSYDLNTATPLPQNGRSDQETEAAANRDSGCDFLTL